MDADAVRGLFEYFDSPDAPVYANTASVGLPSRATITSLSEAAHDWAIKGGADWPSWFAADEKIRVAARALLRRPHVGIVPSASAAAGLVARHVCSEAVARGTRRKCVVLGADFSSVGAPFADAVAAASLELVTVPMLADGQVGLAALLDALQDEGVFACAVSHVQSATGHVLDVARVHAHCRERDIALYVDLTQSLCCVTVPPLESAYVGVAAYKWLLCPKGVAFVSPPNNDTSLSTPWRWWGAHSQPHTAYYGHSGHVLSPDARWDSSSAWLLNVAAASALQQLASLGVDAIVARCEHLARRLRERIDAPILFEGDALCARCPIISVPVDNADAVAAALKQRRVVCAVRARYVRLSLHFYNTDADVDIIAVALNEALHENK